MNTHRNPHRVILIGVAALFAAVASGATTWYVDDNAPNDPGPGDTAISDPAEDGSVAHPYDALQEAVDAATAGDTITILDGTYTGTGNRHVNPAGNDLTIQSENGPASCIIDCQFAGRAFDLVSGETKATVIDGFTIRNGTVTDSSPNGQHGGAIYCDSSSPVIRNCRLEDNRSNGPSFSRGGAICVFDGAPVLEDCTFTGNQAEQAGAAYLNGGPARIERCTFTGNSASNNSGGALWLQNNGAAPFALRDCSITDNNAAYEAGGIGAYSADVDLVNCTVSGNAATTQGGGLSWERGTVNLVNCSVTRNTSDSFAGILAIDNPAVATLVNCVIADNTSTGQGGGFACFGGFSDFGANLHNCTIANNIAAADGGAVMLTGNYATTITNCILYGNTASSGPQLRLRSLAQVAVSYSNVEGGQAAVDADPATTLTWGAGNIDGSPLYASSAPGDYRLLGGSPGVDAGSNDGVPADTFDLDADANTSEPVPLDSVGGPRFYDDPITPDTGSGTAPLVDMGAFEVFPDCNANGVLDDEDLANGTSVDCDYNGVPDECQRDTDSDGTIDNCDDCPADPNKTTPGACGCGTPDTDTDADGTPDCLDNCPGDPAKTDPGTCGCGTPDTDSDADGTPDCNDLCPDDPNKVAPGNCGCGTPDTDTDGDGVADCLDNCIDTPNPDQADADGDGIGDACDDDQAGQSIPDDGGNAGDDQGTDSIDGNNDGIPDDQQDHVASFQTDSGDMITVVAPESVIVTATAAANPSPADMPSDAEFPFGFIAVDLANVAPGAAVSVEILFPQLEGTNAYWKFGPTPDNPTPHWYAFDYDGQTGATFLGNTLLLYYVDGARGDDDLAANGTVADPGAPAFVPAAGEDAALMLPGCGVGVCGFGAFNAFTLTLLGLCGAKTRTRFAARRR
jgi:hypothetical protein